MESSRPFGRNLLIRDAEERLPGGGTAVGYLGRTGEGRDGDSGCGGANCLVAGPGAGDPEALARQILSADEIEGLILRFGKRIKPSELAIGQAVLWIGRLGSHLNRKNDGMPGVRTLWRGLHDLTLLVAGCQAGKKLRE